MLPHTKRSLVEQRLLPTAEDHDRLVAELADQAAEAKAQADRGITDSLRRSRATNSGVMNDLALHPVSSITVKGT